MCGKKISPGTQGKLLKRGNRHTAPTVLAMALAEPGTLSKISD